MDSTDAIPVQHNRSHGKFMWSWCTTPMTIPERFIPSYNRLFISNCMLHTLFNTHIAYQMTFDFIFPSAMAYASVVDRSMQGVIMGTGQKPEICADICIHSLYTLTAAFNSFANLYEHPPCLRTS